ncbi:MAG: hypothetical protein HZA54_07785 [Planctomycetes bacterium]|nr:hypothetical protein [Planctomycetota bacterium]
MADLSRLRGGLESRKVRVVLVHQTPEDVGDAITEHHGVADWARISDPGRALYRAFGLEKGGLLSVLGPKSLLRGAGAFFGGGHRQGGLQGDALQMPGVFVLAGERVTGEFRHASVADRPDYLALVDGAGA